MNQFLYFTNLNGIMFYQKKKNSAFYPLFIGLGCAFCCLLQEMTVNTPVIPRNRFTTITAFQKELQVTVLNNDSFCKKYFFPRFEEDSTHNYILVHLFENQFYNIVILHPLFQSSKCWAHVMIKN